LGFPPRAHGQHFERNTQAALSLARRAVEMEGTALDTRFSAYTYERDFETQTQARLPKPEHSVTDGNLGGVYTRGMYPGDILLRVAYHRAFPGAIPCSGPMTWLVIGHLL